MLKVGFQDVTDGLEKVPKLFSVADEKKIKKFYDNFANQIKSMKLSAIMINLFHIFQLIMELKLLLMINFLV